MNAPTRLLLIAEELVEELAGTPVALPTRDAAEVADALERVLHRRGAAVVDRMPSAGDFLRSQAKRGGGAAA